MSESQARFLLPWRSWALWFIPVIATIAFVWILLVALGQVRTPSVPIATWATVGGVLFGVLLLLLILLMIPRRDRAAEELAAASEIPAETVVPYAPPPRPTTTKIEAEFVATGEQWKGMRVLEVSLPPKSRNKGGVYAKSYVPITGELVLRVEDLVADRRDVSVPNAMG